MAIAARSLALSLLFLSLILLASSPASHSVDAAKGHDNQQHFVLVHGLGHGAWCWYKITALLQKAGHRVTTIDLTSNGINKVVADTVTTLTQYLEPLTQFLTTNDDKVILVGHSLGGSSISYAMELFSEKIEKAIFLAALMPSNNQSFIPTDILQALGGLFPQGVLIQNFANGPSSPPTSISINLNLAKDYFYNESPLEDIALALSLLNPTPFLPLAEVLNLTPTKYGSIPRFYIKTPLDNIIPVAIQASIVQTNPPQQEFSIPGSDHSPFFSRHVILTHILLSIASL